MVTTRAARRYARAVFDIALAEQGLDSWQRDLAAMSIRLMTPDVLSFVANPAVNVGSKQAVVDQALAGMERRRLNLAYLLIERDRLPELPGVAAEFGRLLNQHQNVAEAEITTAVDLPDATALDVERRLVTMTGKRVVLSRRVDPAILGGLVVRMGDRLIDGSLATRLEALRSQLAD